MSDIPTPETDLLIAGCLDVSESTGIAPQYLICHALLLATSMIGGAACYCRTPGQGPQLIGSPAAVLSNDATCPAWFTSATGLFVERQESISRNAVLLSRLSPSAAQIRSARRLEKMYAPVRQLIPGPLAVAMASGVPRIAPPWFEFLHDVRKGSTRRNPDFTAYGPHLMVYAPCEECYRDLLVRRARPDSLLAAASDPDLGSKFTIHGWSRFSPMKALIRRNGPEPLPAFGWLLEFPECHPDPVSPDHVPASYLRFLGLIFEMRMSCPKKFLPEPGIAGILDKAVDEQAARSRGGVLQEMHLNPLPMLPWQIATILWLIESHQGPHPENNPELARRACRIASFIHELHAHTLRRIFPGFDGETIDPFSAAIVDKLSVEPLHLRDLTRKFHRTGSRNLEKRLIVLEGEGIVARNHDGKWGLAGFDAKPFKDIAERLSAKPGGAASAGIS